MTQGVKGGELGTGPPGPPCHPFRPDTAMIISAIAATALTLLAPMDPDVIPDGTRLVAGETCYAVELNGRPVGATRQVVRAAERDGRPVWIIDIHQRLPAMQFDVHDRFEVDRQDLAALRYESTRLASTRAPAQQIEVDYGPSTIRGFRVVGEDRTDISTPADGPVRDGNLWGLTFAALDLHDGARFTVPFWHYEKGHGAFQVAVTGTRSVDTPSGPVEAWVVEAGDGDGPTATYLIARETRAELGYSAGPFSQQPGGDCGDFPALAEPGSR